MQTGICCYLLSPYKRGSLLAIPDAALIWDQSGTISYVGTWQDRPRAENIRWKQLKGSLVTPGFIDVHSHLPQYPNVGCGGHSLLPWLRKFIFPLEKRFTPKRAEVEAPRYFDEMKRNGITSAVIYATVSAESTEVSFQAAEACGLRIAMGQMMMDIDSYAPGSHKGLTSRTLTESAALCERWNGAAGGRLQYAFSPRFAVTCSAPLMKGAADLARHANAYLQTHLAENPQELKTVKSMYPDSKDYTDVYETCGILGPKTIVGHAIHLSSRELETLAATGTKVAHCPSSNLFLSSGVLDFSAMRKLAITVGLASDVAGGPELNPWEVMKAASYSHQIRSSYFPDTYVPGPVELFQLATVGGAKVLGAEKRLGQLQPGFSADIVAWDTSEVMPPGEDLFSGNDPKLILSRLIYRGVKARVEKIWVEGKMVGMP
jgi:guanine deaminase